MFTGIITAIGEITHIESLDSGVRFVISSPYDTSDISIGASISHDGVCLSVVSKTSDSYSVEAWQETLDVTTASDWTIGTRLNLERPLCIGDEFGGHLVLGHIDSTATITSIESEGDAIRMKFLVPSDLSCFIASKGSVCLNGTSLTVNTIDSDIFDILLISHTLSTTTWTERRIGDSVNLEVDMMARYVARLSDKE